MKKGRTQDRVEGILSNMMNACLNGDSAAVRRGAAYGTSAVVKGSGIATLKKYEVMKELEDACASGAANANLPYLLLNFCRTELAFCSNLTSLCSCHPYSKHSATTVIMSEKLLQVLLI